MTDPAGSDRMQQDIPTGSGSGDGSDLGSSFDDVPLTSEEGAARDAAQDDEQPARPGSDVSMTRRSGATDAGDPDRQGTP